MKNIFYIFELSFHGILLVALFVRLIKVQQPPLGLVVHLFSWHVGLRQEGHLTLESGKDQVSFIPLDQRSSLDLSIVGQVYFGQS